MNKISKTAARALTMIAIVVRDYDRYRAKGIEFVREPTKEPFGTVAVFRDLYGNLWDLIEPA